MKDNKIASEGQLGGVVFVRNEYQYSNVYYS